jgi:hypothetical protein
MRPLRAKLRGRLLLTAVLGFGILQGCTGPSKEPNGWTHSCTLTCLNRQTGASEKIERLGRNAAGDPVCKPAKVTCDAGRSAACVSAAQWVNTHEPLYKNCEAVAFGECTPSCSIEH